MKPHDLMSDFNPGLSLRASSLFGGYREKGTRERHARGDARRVLARLASLSQIRELAGKYRSCYRLFFLSQQFSFMFITGCTFKNNFLFCQVWIFNEIPFFLLATAVELLTTGVPTCPKITIEQCSNTPTHLKKTTQVFLFYFFSLKSIS